MTKTINGGRLIFFDGIDGVGKTTQLEAVRQCLTDEGWLVYTSRIHGGTPIGEALREVSFKDLPRPATTDLYISLAMHQALIEQCAKWRSEGAIILIDRSPLSIMAYQVSDGLDSTAALQATTDSMNGFRPDLTILYTADVSAALERVKQKPGWADYFSTKPADYFELCQAGYLEAATKFEVEIVDANQKLSTVSNQTWALIRSKLI